MLSSAKYLNTPKGYYLPKTPYTGVKVVYHNHTFIDIDLLLMRGDENS